jgi:hypothetical protein
VAQTRDPTERLRRAVSLLCAVTERVAPLYEIARSGAIDVEVRALLDRHEEQRRRTHRELVSLIADALQDGIDLDEATDGLYALLSHEVYWLLVQRCGWTSRRWRRLMQQQAADQLLRAAPPDRDETRSIRLGIRRPRSVRR